jgi:hypothetical protein
VIGRFVPLACWLAIGSCTPVAHTPVIEVSTDPVADLQQLPAAPPPVPPPKPKPRAAFVPRPAPPAPPPLLATALISDAPEPDQGRIPAAQIPDPFHPKVITSEGTKATADATQFVGSASSKSGQIIALTGLTSRVNLAVKKMERDKSPSGEYVIEDVRAARSAVDDLQAFLKNTGATPP